MVGLSSKPVVGLIFSGSFCVGRAIGRAVGFVFTRHPAAQKIMREGFVVPSMAVPIEKAIALEGKKR